MPSTFRAGITAGLKTILDDFKAAHGDLLVATFRTRPESFDKDTPFAFVERWAESIHHDPGIRFRTATPAIIYVDRLTLNDETVARRDTLVDLMVDHITAYPHIMPVTSWEDMTVEDLFEDGFWATRFTFGDITVQEGRE
jgi:hypothetical protein